MTARSYSCTTFRQTHREKGRVRRTSSMETEVSTHLRSVRRNRRVRRMRRVRRGKRVRRNRRVRRRRR